MFMLFFCLSFFTLLLFVFFFNDTATTEIYTLSLHDALPIWTDAPILVLSGRTDSIDKVDALDAGARSEEHTSELQSHSDLVCRLLLEKKKKIKIQLFILKKKKKNKKKK